MWKTRLAITGIALVVIFATGLFIGFAVTRLFINPAAPRLLNTSVLLQQVQSLSELVTVKYIMEKVVVLEDPPKDTLSKLFAGESRVIMVASGVIKAGVDLSKLKDSDLQLHGTNISLTLPSSNIMDVYLDDKKTQILEHKTGLLRQYDHELQQAARRQAVDDMRRAAKYQGIINEADTRAKAELSRLFGSLGLKVEFK